MSQGSAIVVGAGLMGRWHAHAIQAVGGRIAGVVDPDLARARAIAEPFRARAATDLRELSDLSPAVVHVCTPVHTHVELATRALATGAAVLVEKPFAASAGDTGRLLAAAAAAGRFACPVHQFLFQPGVRSALARLPRLGRLLHVDLVACSAGAEAAPERRGAIALEILPHALSLLQRVIQVDLDQVSWHVVARAAGEIRVVGAAGSATATVLISLAGRPTRNSMRLVTEGGTSHADLFHGYEVFEAPSTSRSRKIARPFLLAGSAIVAAGANLAGRTLRREPAYPGLRELVRLVHAAARGSGPVPISPEETLGVARATDGIAALVADAFGGGA